MAKVNISNVVVLDNPSPFLNPFQFEITFECLEDLPEDLEWKIIYVGSAESMDYDQVLDSVLVGPVPGGRHMFVFQAGPPDTSKIPIADAVGVTVVLLTCSYKSKEFIRVGYYVNNEYSDPELKETPPDMPVYDKDQKIFQIPTAADTLQDSYETHKGLLLLHLRQSCCYTQTSWITSRVGPFG
ncbi:histone chaperone asf1b-B-like isoform X2 [Octopus sinensis]|uniref:Histone chaperone asf1b-B-like isoform X2 n=1 Tax=Octopus sinensis TaxID=2607531 RepID=A0A7E6F462_9MOLL|nr:histone chaperone asf1b-B-like isoform X2 [Octopus sinensis]